MRELRIDPVTGTPVIIAPNRAKRPIAIYEPDQVSPNDACPFCRDQLRTPAPVATYGGPPDKWQVCVVPNLFPALELSDTADQSSGLSDPPVRPIADRPYLAVGVHEVIIESPHHTRALTEQQPDEIQWTLRAYRDRWRHYRHHGRLYGALPFKNVGAAAGASLEHAHSQFVVFPFLPPRLRCELEGALRYRETAGRCPFCDMAANSNGHNPQVLRNDDFTVVCPYASRFPFEMCIVPNRHLPRFEEADDRLLYSLSCALHRSIKCLENVLGSPSYNLLVHSSPFHPFDTNDPDHYHWHMEIIPRTAKVAGFEWGADCFINPIPPDEAAVELTAS